MEPSIAHIGKFNRDIGTGGAHLNRSRLSMRDKPNIPIITYRKLASGVIEDPVYLARPVEWSGQWMYRPNMPHSNEKCDLQVAHKFLSEAK
jgi:hypothetical protein